MIISRTPLRISFAGGGSDLPTFYRKYGGAVLSSAVDKYIYVSVNRKFDDGIRIAYSKNEEVENVDEIEHKLVRATLKYLNISGGIEITTIADIPSRGTGLGSSSSFTVGLCNALFAYQGRHISSDELAQKSCHLEIELCGEPIGKQDQYAAAYGGFNFIEFYPDESVCVTPVIMLPSLNKMLEKRTLIFYTGITRSGSVILQTQSDEVDANPAKQATLRRMVELAFQMRDELQNANLDSIGEILHESWILKKSLTRAISTDAIDTWYNTARANGALGGKILGAGSGGFLMFHAPEERHEAIMRSLAPLRRIYLGFVSSGSRIIFYQP